MFARNLAMTETRNLCAACREVDGERFVRPHSNAGRGNINVTER
jgi:hypothetical protein